MSEQQLDLLEPTPDSQELLPATLPPDETPEEEYTNLYLDMEPLSRIADGKVVRIPRNPHFSRKEVVNAFNEAFKLIGGVPRLALWGHENPNEFFKLYGKLLPSGSSSALGVATELHIKIDVPDSPLDLQEVPVLAQQTK